MIAGMENSTITLAMRSKPLCEVKHVHVLCTRNCTSSHFAKETKTYAQKDMYENDHSGFARSSPELEAISSRRIDVQTIVCSPNGILLSNENEQLTGTTTWIKFKKLTGNRKSQI